MCLQPPGRSIPGANTQSDVPALTARFISGPSNTGTAAAVLSNAPIDNTAIITTDERFVFALGAGGEGDRVEWCDQENNNVWAATATNQAGGFTLTTSGNILAAEQLRGETLILTTTDAHVARYQGPPFVFGFQRVGTGCGIASSNACVKADSFAIWMGNKRFLRVRRRRQKPAQHGR